MRKILNYFLANLFPSFTAYLLIPVYGLYLTKSEYGIVGKLEVFTYIFTILSSLALDRAIVRYYFETNRKFTRQEILSSILWLTLLFSLIFAFFGYYLINYSGVKIVENEIILYYLILSIIINNQGAMVLRIVQARGDSAFFLAMQISKAISILIFSYLYLVYFSGGLEGYAQGVFVSSLVLFPFIFIEYKKTLCFSFNSNIALSVLKFSIPFIPTLLAAWLFSMFGRIIVETFSGIEALADFTMSFKLASVLLLVNTSIVLAFTPYFFKKASDALSLYDLNLSIELIHRISFILCLLYSFLINDFINWMLPSKYYGITPYVVILNVALFVSCTMSYSSNLIYLHFKKTLQHMTIYLLVGVLAAVISYFAGSFYGIIGVCYSLLINNFILYTVHTVNARAYSTILSPNIYLIVLMAVIVLLSAQLGVYMTNLGWMFILIKFTMAIGIMFLLLVNYIFPYKKSIILNRVK